MRVLFVENRDSFSWNVIATLPVPRASVRVVNAVEALARLDHADVLVIGPGPTDPVRARLVELVHAAAQRGLPTLGVCLGHQALGLAFGAKLARSMPAHGKRASVTFSGAARLPGIDGQLEVMRYHSLSLTDVQEPLRVTARLADGTVMAVEHASLPMVGVQFHPDSFGTPRGRELVAAFWRGLGLPVEETDPRPAPSPAPVPTPEVDGPRGDAGDGARPSRPSVLDATPPRRLVVSQLLGSSDFALLGPGFTDGRHWVLAHFVEEPRANATLWVAKGDERVATRHRVFVERVAPELDAPPQALTPALADGAFLRGVRAIREQIAAGDVYQVNLTVRATLAGAPGDALLATLCRTRVPRFAAWVRSTSVGEFVSASPELLVEREGRRVHVEPMKGTAPPTQRAWLEASEKDRAELAMITDLLRDDLHRLCEPGSVRVTNPRRFIELPYVLQTVSDVEGVLPPGVTTWQLLQQLHPGGSVTGAPREAALDTIEFLESPSRGAYCGALGLELDDTLRAALLIRTAERRGEAWSYGVGSGITWDSVPEDELAEVRLKLGALGPQPSQSA